MVVWMLDLAVRVQYCRVEMQLRCDVIEELANQVKQRIVSSVSILDLDL